MVLAQVITDKNSTTQTSVNSIAKTEFISSYAAQADLGLILEYALKKHPELAGKIAKLAVQYRQYMYLVATGLFQNISAPSETVDLIWQAHILHTVHYSEFCHNLCGHYIHHNPFEDGVTLMMRQAAKDQLFQASLTVFDANVFDAKSLSGDCGYCGGCSNCAGDCGGMVTATNSPNCGQCSGCDSCGPSCGAVDTNIQ